jgi:hypothetical protein
MLDESNEPSALRTRASTTSLAATANTMKAVANANGRIRVRRLVFDPWNKFVREKDFDRSAANKPATMPTAIKKSIHTVKPTPTPRAE